MKPFLFAALGALVGAAAAHIIQIEVRAPGGTPNFFITGFVAAVLGALGWRRGKAGGGL